MDESELELSSSDDSESSSIESIPLGKKRRKLRSVVWDHFQKVGDASRCLFDDFETIISTQNTTTLKRHLSRMHPEYDVMKIKTALKDRIEKWIITSMVPLHAVDHQEFKDLFDENVVGSDALIANLKVKKNNQLLALKHYFATLNCKINFTLDIWTSTAPKSYLGVNAHWIDKYQIGKIFLFYLLYFYKILICSYKSASINLF